MVRKFRHQPLLKFYQNDGHTIASVRRVTASPYDGLSSVKRGTRSDDHVTERLYLVGYDHVQGRFEMIVITRDPQPCRNGVDADPFFEACRTAFGHKTLKQWGHKGVSIELYVFDYENFSSDDLLGKVTLMLPDPLPEEPVFTVLDRAWLKVEPCFTSEQDKLNSHTNMQRRVTKAIRIFHDDAHLYKEDTLGEVMVSVTAFRLEELPALVRDRETTIDRLRNRLTHHRRLSQSTLADTTLRLQAELGGARREAAMAGLGEGMTLGGRCAGVWAGVLHGSSAGGIRAPC